MLNLNFITKNSNSIFPPLDKIFFCGFLRKIRLHFEQRFSNHKRIYKDKRKYSRKIWWPILNLVMNFVTTYWQIPVQHKHFWLYSKLVIVEMKRNDFQDWNLELKWYEIWNTIYGQQNFLVTIEIYFKMEQISIFPCKMHVSGQFNIHLLG